MAHLDTSSSTIISELLSIDGPPTRWPPTLTTQNIPTDIFSAWLCEYISHRLSWDKLFQQQVSIRALYQANREILAVSSSAVHACEVAYQRAKLYVRITELEPQIEKLCAMTTGLQTFLGSTPEGKCEHKLVSAQNKLSHAEQELAEVRAELSAALADTPEFEQLDAAKRNLADVRKACGLTEAEDKLAELRQVTGMNFLQAGHTCVSFSKFSLAHKQQENKAETSVASTIASVISSNCVTDCSSLVLIRNVTIGMANAELDELVLLILYLDIIFKLVQPGESELVPVKVLAIGEAKSNICDIGRAFSRFQQTLSWLKGEKDRYDPTTFKTKTYKTGHFTPTKHVDKATKRTFLLAPESFDSFTREANGLFMRKIVWFTYVSPLLPFDSGDLNHILHHVGTASDLPSLLTSGKNLQDAAVMQECARIQEWSNVNIAPTHFSTCQVFEMYKELSLEDHFIFLSRKNM